MPLILGTNSIKDTGYEVDNSLRFDDGSSDYLSRTPSSASNRKTFTFSAWVKRCNESGANVIFQQGSDSANRFALNFQNEKLRWRGLTGGSNEAYLQTNRAFRDPSAWYHIVARFDSTNATAGDRMRLYVNGVEETDFATDVNPSLNYESFVNTTNPIDIGRDNASNDSFFDGYLAEVVFIDGTALDPTSFGEFDEDTGIWKPIDVSGLTFGTNGFYLPFENSGALGQDDSGNGNNFTVNNLTSIDQSTDTCTINFATMNALDLYFTNDTLSEGNLLVTNGANYGFPISTFGLSSGKWYFECQTSSWTSGDLAVGISAKGSDAIGDEFSNNTGGGKGYGFRSNGGVYGNSATIVGAGTYTTGSGTHIIGMALNLDDNKLAFSVNGTWQGSTDPGAGTTNMISIEASSTNDTGVYFIALSGANSGAQTMNANFGSPAFSISSGNSDGNGYGNFEYSVPSGYYALNTKNLAEYG